MEKEESKEAKLRSKSVLRAVERLININAFSDEESLWKATRCMSGDEFEQALEERNLGNLCASPLCDKDVGQNEMNKSYRNFGMNEENESPQTYHCCCESCSAAISKHARKLGNRKDAAGRFRTLLRLAREQQRSRNGKAGVDVGRRELDRKGELAAGTREAPVMKKVVEERKSLGVDMRKTDPSDIFQADSIEGYAPKTKARREKGLSGEVGNKMEEKRVTFADELESFAPSEPNGPQTENVDENDNRSDDAPRIVFEVEDPSGPVDSQTASLESQFGTLRIENYDNFDSEALLGNDNCTIDKELLQIMKQGTLKYFPQLEGCFPPEISNKWDKESEQSADDGRSSEGSLFSDDDFLSEEEDPIYCQKTFFTEIYAYIDAWVTDKTIAQIKPVDTVSRDQTVLEPIPQVPEIMTSIQRLISIAVVSMSDKLQAESIRSVMQAEISNVIRTFRLDQSLPAFQSRQWIIISLLIFKALSLEKYPEFQAYLDTRDSIARVGTILADASFTMEEFYAVLDILLGG
eukprot:jgi/Picsp_1/2640/NSC_00870-R1_rpap2_arath ame: full= rna polymerase ii subunit b1 ctd phosphatase rpap2 homolog ame: full=rna polymerase ii-associated protein 2 homolog